jgi:hypothetical protein
MGKTPFSPPRRPRSRASNQAPASHFPPCGSKHYLPTPRTALNCPFLGSFRTTDFT